MRTKLEALEAGAMGWNLRCQTCGTYGALWRNPCCNPCQGNRLRLCDECDEKRHRVFRAFRRYEEVFFAQSSIDQGESAAEVRRRAAL